MVSLNSNEAGVSLIELMVTIAILAILTVTGISLTSKWSQQAELDKAIMSLKSGMSLAKSTAMRNGSARAVTDAASQVCFNNSSISVHEATAAAAASCLTPTVFQYSLSNAIAIKKADSTNFSCFAFDHFGEVLSIGNCQTNLSLTVSNGSLNETLNLS